VRILQGKPSPIRIVTGESNVALSIWMLSSEVSSWCRAAPMNARRRHWLQKIHRPAALRASKTEPRPEPSQLWN
jgi:hypothetical protein